MAEPSQAASAVVAAALSATAVSSLSPFVSQYLLIFVGGFFGGMFALNSVPPFARTGPAVLFLIRSVGAAVLFSSLGSTMLAAKLGVQTEVLWMPVSGVIAMYAHEVFELSHSWLKDIGDSVITLIKSKLNRKPRDKQ